MSGLGPGSIGEGNVRLAPGEVHRGVSGGFHRVEGEAQVASGLLPDRPGQLFGELFRLVQQRVRLFRSARPGQQPPHGALPGRYPALQEMVPAGPLQTLGHESRGHVLEDRDGAVFLPQQPAHRVFHGLVVHCEDMAPEEPPHFGFHGRDELHGLLATRRLGGDAHVHLARVGQHAHRGVARLGDQAADLVVHRAFPHVRHLQHPVGKGLRKFELAPGVGDHLVLEQPLHLMGHSGQRIDDALFVLDDEGRRGAVGVLHRNGAFGDVGLALVVGGHDHVAPAEPPVDLLQQPRVPHELAAAHLGDDLPGEVVPGRPEPAAGDDQVGPVQGPADDVLHASGVVAHDGLEEEVDPQVGQALGHPRGVGIDDLAQQQFRPNGDDFSVRHDRLLPMFVYSFAYPPYTASPRGPATSSGAVRRPQPSVTSSHREYRVGVSTSVNTVARASPPSTAEPRPR